MRPLIGVTSSVDRARWDVWEDEVVLVESAYVRHLGEAGARTVVLPPGAVDDSVVDVLDGLVVAGGRDIAPVRYSATPSPWTSGVDEEQDAAEVALMRGALRRGLPVLGICRGMQLLAVAHGGALHQHLPDVPQHRDHGGWNGTWTNHRVDLVPGSRIAEALTSPVIVNSGHHQGVADPGSLTVTGWSPDGLAEAVEQPDHPFVVGVQWHPEMLGQQRLFSALTDAARSAMHPS